VTPKPARKRARLVLLAYEPSYLDRRDLRDSSRFNHLGSLPRVVLDDKLLLRSTASGRGAAALSIDPASFAASTLSHSGTWRAFNWPRRPL